MAKTKYRVARSENISSGGVDYTLVAGEIRDDLPEDLIEALGGDYGAVVEATDEDLANVKVAEQTAADAVAAANVPHMEEEGG